MKGKIKWFNAKKGYGFIIGEDEKEIFVHRNDVPSGTYLNDNDQVEYSVESTEKGMQAKNIKKL